jgi:hypothetical protein
MHAATNLLIMVLVTIGQAQQGDRDQWPADSVVTDTLREAPADSASITADSTGGQSSRQEEPSDEFKAAAADSSWWYRKLENNSFGVGERLEFSVKYGMLPAGSAVMKVSEVTEYQGRPSFRIISTAESNNVVSVFYKVRDSVETIVDYDGIFPRKFHKRLREGGYKADKTTLFDQRKHLAIAGNDTIPTYAFVQDALSSLYFIRIQELSPGQEILIDNHTDKKNYPLKVIVIRKETVDVPAGKFDCLVIEPVMRAEGIFKAKGRIWIWLTDDQYKIPVMMKTEVYFLGSITAQLKKYEHGTIGTENEQVQEN